MTKWNRWERGAAAVEFAMVLPVLLMLLLGIMEFGYSFLLQSSLSGAARGGARYYAINFHSGDATAQKTAVIDEATVRIKDAVIDGNSKISSVTFTPACTPGATTELIVTYSYQSLTGMFDSLLGHSLIGKGSMQCGG